MAMKVFWMVVKETAFSFPLKMDFSSEEAAAVAAVATSWNSVRTYGEPEMTFLEAATNPLEAETTSWQAGERISSLDAENGSRSSHCGIVRMRKRKTWTWTENETAKGSGSGNPSLRTNATANSSGIQNPSGSPAELGRVSPWLRWSRRRRELAS